MNKILKPATPADFGFYFKIKSEENNIYWTGHTQKPEHKKLQEWFETNIHREDRIILIYFVDQTPVGYSYIDKTFEHYETSLAVADAYAGKGYGSEIILETLSYIKKIDPLKPIFAWVFDKNLASIKIHQKAGYEKTSETKSMSLASLQEPMTRYKAK